MLSVDQTDPPVLDTSASSISSVSSQIKIPKLSLPTFHGDPMKWAVFWEGFDAAIHSNTSLDNSSKLTYLREAIKDSKVTHLLHRATSSATQYEDLVRLLIDRYDQKRLIHQNHSLALVNCAHIKQGSHEEPCMFIDTIRAQC